MPLTPCPTTTLLKSQLCIVYFGCYVAVAHTKLYGFVIQKVSYGLMVIFHLMHKLSVSTKAKQ